MHFSAKIATKTYNWIHDRMLEFVGAIDTSKTDERVLDKLKVEKEPKQSRCTQSINPQVLKLGKKLNKNAKK